MTFRSECCDDFEALFERYRMRIRAAEGCRYLALLKESPDGTVYFTHSLWDDASFLDVYRSSDTFAEVWPQTKAMFAAPAEAWTLDQLHEMP